MENTALLHRHFMEPVYLSMPESLQYIFDRVKEDLQNRADNNFITPLLAGPDTQVLTKNEIVFIESYLSRSVSPSVMPQKQQQTRCTQTRESRRKLEKILAHNQKLRRETNEIAQPDNPSKDGLDHVRILKEIRRAFQELLNAYYDHNTARGEKDEKRISEANLRENELSFYALNLAVKYRAVLNKCRDDFGLINRSIRKRLNDLEDWAGGTDKDKEETRDAEVGEQGSIGLWTFAFCLKNEESKADSDWLDQLDRWVECRQAQPGVIEEGKPTDEKDEVEGEMNGDGRGLSEEDQKDRVKYLVALEWFRKQTKRKTKYRKIFCKLTGLIHKKKEGELGIDTLERWEKSPKGIIAIRQYSKIPEVKAYLVDFKERLAKTSDASDEPTSN